MKSEINFSNNGNSDIFVSETAQTSSSISVTNSNTAFTISATKEGYKPISFSDIGYGYSSYIEATWESKTLDDETFEVSGYARNVVNSTSLTNISFYCYVLWMKI